RALATDQQLLSTRYRAGEGAWTTLAGQVHRQTRHLRRAVHVTSSTVNFLAEEGALQVTLVNNLDADLQGVRLTLEAGSRDVQIPEQPGPLRSGAHGRTSVGGQVSALGSGDVPVGARLTTPNGTRLGTQSSVLVHVQPA